MICSGIMKSIRIDNNTLEEMYECRQTRIS